MRKVIIMFALAMGIATARAQENVTVETNNGSNEQPTLTKEVYPQKEADGDPINFNAILCRTPQELYTALANDLETEIQVS